MSPSENTSHTVKYLGPVSRDAPTHDSLWEGLRKRVPLAFIIMVVVPTLLAAVYFLLIATPRYTAEARFVVRQASKEQPSSLGLVLQGAGISTSQTDAFAVHQYMDSRDALRDLMERLPIREIYSPAKADPLSRVPSIGSGSSFEDLYKGMNRYVEVGYDSTSGISVLRVQAFDPSDAQRVSLALLDSGERLVNRLNTRAQGDAVQEAERTVVEAQDRAALARTRMAEFRNREGIVDPAQSVEASSALLGSLETTLAGLRAERSQIASGAPASPQLPVIDSRIAAYARQIEIEKARVTGGANSLASKAGLYEQLTTERDFAERAVLAANQAVVTARLEGRRQQLYLERIVSPDLADESSEPRRWLSILTVLAVSLTAYFTGWLIMSGIRESHQG